MVIPALLLALQAVRAGPTQSVDAVVQDGIRTGVYPGAVAVIGTSQRILLARGYGHFTWSGSSAVPDPDSTLFDLASLTKVVATLPSVMVLVQDGRVRLDDPVQTYLPEFRGDGKERVSVRNLLEHRSGLRAFLPLNERAKTAEEARRLVMEEPLRWPPGQRVVYSDLNAMLLGWIVERVTGERLDAFATRAVFAPIGMHETRYLPPRSERRRVMPVGLWHGHAIAGEIHDQNAARLGGVSGHAGLYSTGADLARYARMWLDGGRLSDGRQLFHEGLVAAFRRRGPGNRALGWEMRDTSATENTGHRLSAATFGHTGYTGTSIWIDPERGVFVILLTNRVFAPRVSRPITRLKEIRGRLADAAVALFEQACRGNSAEQC